MGMYSAMMKQVHGHADRMEKSGELERMFQRKEPAMPTLGDLMPMNRIHWTNEKPTTPGWYWHRKHSCEPEVVKVVRFRSGDLGAWLSDCEETWAWNISEDTEYREWANLSRFMEGSDDANNTKGGTDV